MKALALVLTLTISSPICFATTVVGHGAISCGEYMEDVRRLPQSGNQATRGDTWAMGYVSALNQYVLRKDVLKDADSAGIRGALRQYCEKNPLDSVADAAADVAIQLGRRADALPTSVPNSKKQPVR